MIAAGLCQCGCGAPTRVAKHTDRRAGQFRGQPLAYIVGHNFHAGKRGAESPNWKGGRSVAHGYVTVDRQYEHITIAERVLGRKLPQYGKGDPRNLVVHHVDGNKQNNVKTNLLICTHAYHTALHHRLEQSAAWPEFPKVVRNVGSKSA
jgi:HNH endonuclease.